MSHCGNVADDVENKRKDNEHLTCIVSEGLKDYLGIHVTDLRICGVWSAEASAVIKKE